MSSLAIKRLESLALREVSMLLQSNSKFQSLKDVIVTEVRITSDLSFMTIYYTIYTSQNRETLLAKLEENKGSIRMQLAKKLKARKMPQLIFTYDEALAYGNHIAELVQKEKDKFENKD